MCGISGVINFSENDYKVEGQQVLDKMIHALSHRGPDETGVWYNKKVYLGHKRLSIIDLAGGHQPLFSETGKHVLVYNGEVYNYKELKKDLVQSHSFKSDSDSEVLIHLYEDLGATFSDLLDGMFAYAIWDDKKNILNLGVDPFGIKPLYYYIDQNCFLFSSEITSLVKGLKAANIHMPINHEAVSYYLKQGWIAAPETILKGVFKLLPGQRLQLTSSGELTQLQSIQAPISEGYIYPNKDKCVSKLDAILKKSIDSQLVADVPVGILLSGGIDSSLITAIAAQEHNSLKTFSVGFSGQSREVMKVDESKVAREVAEHFGTEHHEIIVNGHDLLSVVDNALTAMGEPIADPAILPLLLISRFASKEVKVCLCGDGGDEMFGGYRRFQVHPYKQWFHTMPPLLQALIQKGSKLLPESPSSGLREVLRKARVGIDFIADAQYSIGPFSGENAQWLSGAYSICEGVYPLDDIGVFKAELYGGLPGQLLPKTDRISMSASLEVRVPFLSNEVCAFASSIPRTLKVRNGVGKYILRELSAKYIPQHIASRPKHGFRVPISTWFRDEMKEYIYAKLDVESEFLDAHITRKSRRELMDRHVKCKAEHSIRIWALLALVHAYEKILEV